ncbi:MAG: phosphate starvation-inducible protein PhoH [Desulfobacterales bacterium GWB2_56_26]|nr:MAG: phosphate starvation-inducible protein PhoH [Desulfobacterales bacterium GWB2_56_26]
MKGPKHFVLDTNVLLHNPESINSFGDNYVVLPMTVIEELDNFKRTNDELGRSARQVIRQLDHLRSVGTLKNGVKLPNGGVLKISLEEKSIKGAFLDMSIPDNRILAVATNLAAQKEKVIFVSKDISARLKADALGIEVMDFEQQKCDFDSLYSGWREVAVAGQIIDAFYKEKILIMPGKDFIANEFIILRDQENPKHTGFARALGRDSVTHLDPAFESAWELRARSKEQRMALELLLDPKINLITLIGRAGTGKTLLALAAGLHCVLRLETYDKLLVSRPIIPMGRDIGYLPGTKDDKLSLWMQPIFDNLAYLMRLGHKFEDGTVQNKIDQLIKNQQIELEALTYIRGRSIPDQFVIVDEAQNLTPHEVKTIVSRAGENTKMVITGDPNQIDNPYLDASSNGLAYAVEKLKGQPLYGHVTLSKSERSPLSAVAADFL